MSIDSLELPETSYHRYYSCNGARKSTFAKCFCGLNKGFKGNLSIKKKDTYMVMQDVNHQLFTETVLDEVLLSMKKRDPQKSKEILKHLNLLPFKNLHPLSLSGGQKQRVASAGAIASEKSIIIFDEPTSGLDLKHMTQVSMNLKSLKKAGKTLLVITHDLELILKTCD